MASPVAWITSALDSTFWAKACEGSGHKGSPLAATPRPPAGPTHLHGVHAVLLGGGHIEPDLHERDLGVVVLVELQRHLVLARGALGHVAERDLEHRLLPDVKGQQLPCGDVTASSELCPANPISSHSLAPLPKSSSASALTTAFPPSKTPRLSPFWLHATGGNVPPHGLGLSLGLTSKPHRAPVPALHTQILLRQLQTIVGLEEVRELVEFLGWARGREHHQETP